MAAWPFKVSAGASSTTRGLDSERQHFSGNSCWYGGGISNNWLGGGGSGRATITNSTLSGNSASYGGGILNQAGTLTVSNSTFSGNSAEYAEGRSKTALTATTLTIANSTLSGNSATNGGAIANDLGGTVTMTNSTLSGNSAGGHPNILYNGFGGGIFNAQTVTMSAALLAATRPKTTAAPFTIAAPSATQF